MVNSIFLHSYYDFTHGRRREEFTCWNTQPRWNVGRVFKILTLISEVGPGVPIPLQVPIFYVRGAHLFHPKAPDL